MIVTPVRASPAKIACWTGLAPRHRGSWEKCTLIDPWTGIRMSSPASS
jgi:hypothetical protein